MARTLVNASNVETVIAEALDTHPAVRAIICDAVVAAMDPALIREVEEGWYLYTPCFETLAEVSPGFRRALEDARIERVEREYYEDCAREAAEEAALAGEEAGE